MANNDGMTIYRDRISSRFLKVLDKYAPNEFVFKNDKVLFLEKKLYDSIKSWKQNNIEVTRKLRELHISAKAKKIIVADLDEKGILAKEWYSELFGGTFVKVDKVEEFAQMMNNYKLPASSDKAISTVSIKAKYGVPKTNVEYALAAGRIKDYGGLFAVAEVEALVKFDSKLLSLRSVLEGFENKYQVKITTKIHQHIMDELSLGDINYYKGDTLFRKEVNAKDFYFEQGNISEEKISDIIVHFPGGFPSTWQPFLWSRIPQKTKDYISKYIGTEEGKIVNNPKLQHILNAAAKLGKEIDKWNEGDLTMLTREGLGKSACTEMTRFINHVKSKGVEIRCNTKEIAEFENANQKKFKYNEYSYEQFFELSTLVFDSLDPNESANLKQAIADPKIAQVFMYLALHFSVVWRKTNVTTIEVHPIEDINVLINDIYESRVDNSRLVEIWGGLESTWSILHLANKNGGDLVFWAPSNLYAMLGAYLTVAEYHRIRNKKNYLMDKDILSKKRYYEQAMGVENYRRLFGDETFSGTKLNKVVLMRFVEKTNLKYKEVTVRSLGELVAAHLRGHKLDLNHGQKSILHYISSRSEGLTIDEISYELFLAGTVGYYKHLIVEKILPEYTKLRFKEQNVIINSLDVIPMEMEEKIENFEIMYREVASITNNYYEGFSQFTFDIGHRLHKGFGKANEKNVICVYSLVAGERPDICKEQRYCTGCGETNYKGLCKYGLYAKQYIHNLLVRKQELEEVNKRIDELGWRTAGKEGLKGTYDRNNEIIRFLNRVMDNFVLESEIPKEVEQAIRTHYVEVTENAVKKL